MWRGKEGSTSRNLGGAERRLVHLEHGDRTGRGEESLQGPGDFKI